MRSLLTIVACLLVAPVPAILEHQATSQAASEPRDVANRLIAALNALDFPALRALYADSAQVEDPTVGMSVAGGAEIVKQFEGGYAIVDESRWLVQGGFTTGSWTVLHGTLYSRLNGDRIGRPGARPEGAQRFVTALQVEGGRVVRHLDFLDYDAWDEANPTVPVPVTRRREARTELASLGDRFVGMLNASPPSVEVAMTLYGDELIFEDPTFGLRQQGKARFRDAVADLWTKTGDVEATTVVEDRILSGSFVILRGTYSQKRTPAAPKDDRVWMSFVTVLEVRSGQIVHQWDFFDKDGFDRKMGGKDDGPR
jgi:ketosteroid isomerase-like protein